MLQGYHFDRAKHAHKDIPKCSKHLRGGFVVGHKVLLYIPPVDMPVGMNCIGIVWHIVASRVRTLWLVGKACSFGLLPPTMPSKWSLGVFCRVPAFQRFKWEAKGKHAFCVGGGVHILRQVHGVLNRRKFEAGGDLGLLRGTLHHALRGATPRITGSRKTSA